MIEILADSMKRIVAGQEEHELLAEGFGGPQGPNEGPVWIKEGGYLLFSDIHTSKRWKWHPKEGLSLDAANTGHGNGMTRDPQSRLVICHQYTRCVDRIEADGSVTVIAGSYHGMRINRPNDVVVSSDGAIYFTDPPPRPRLTHHQYSDIDIAGVYRVSPDLTRINMVLRNFVNPNGLCFSPDEKILYVNDSHRSRKLVMAYEVEDNGIPDWGTERLFVDAKGDDRPGTPDGMKCDVEGNVYVSAPGGIWVIDPEGQHIGTIQGRAVNFAWGGDDWSTLYITAGNTLTRIRLGIPGVPVPRGKI